MITVRWRLKELLQSEGITQYQLMKLAQGRVSKNTIGSAVRNELNGVQFSTLAAIIDVLESHLDRQIGIAEIIEVRREIIDE
jgi:transcriptional regulator with XRE-family HTH domain